MKSQDYTIRILVSFDALSLILSGVLLGLVLGCEAGENGGNSKFVRGTVRDSLTHVPIESAKVYLGSVHDTLLTNVQGLTGSDGKYLVLVGYGTNSVGATVVVKKQGYQNAGCEFNTIHVDTATVNFLLTPLR